MSAHRVAGEPFFENAVIKSVNYPGRHEAVINTYGRGITGFCPLGSLLKHGSSSNDTAVRESCHQSIGSSFLVCKSVYVHLGSIYAQISLSDLFVKYPLKRQTQVVCCSRSFDTQALKEPPNQELPKEYSAASTMVYMCLPQRLSTLWELAQVGSTFSREQALDLLWVQPSNELDCRVVAGSNP